jgi:EAL domain-containing protein (putative c-di-GMP-specific phosphodiesterase class I)/ActR/RegA family two-component response regulator
MQNRFAARVAAAVTPGASPSRPAIQPAPGGFGSGPSGALLAAATVLVVDDQEANVVLLERVLRLAGATRVHGVTDPRQAVRRCLEVQPDLVLLDLHMPHLDGVEVMEALRGALADDAFLPVLVLTADVTRESRERALAAGAKDFLTKPFDRTEVVLRAQNLLETRWLYARLQGHAAELEDQVRRQGAQELRQAAERQQKRQRIARVLGSDALTMVFQPIVDLDTGQVAGTESLARFACEPRRPPNEWFAEAAEVGMGSELELAAVASALTGLDDLPPAAYMAVNVSPATAVMPALARLLARSPGSRVVLELTEHTRVEDYDTLLEALDGVRCQGVRVAVDDAGAGYAGLTHILRLRPDIIKLDIDLTRGIDADPVRRALAASLVTFGSDIGAAITAEGIETGEECEVLRALGVDWGQGYYLARPGPLPLASLPASSVRPQRP